MHLRTSALCPTLDLQLGNRPWLLRRLQGALGSEAESSTKEKQRGSFCKVKEEGEGFVLVEIQEENSGAQGRAGSKKEANGIGHAGHRETVGIVFS